MRRSGRTCSGSIDPGLAAKEARLRAYAPYSHFPVGAAVQTVGGKIYSGCNIENASFGLTNCAERTAIFTAVAAGEQELQAIAVVANTPEPVAPCGACRQVMAEFGIQTIIMANTKGDSHVASLKDLLPYSFIKFDVAGDDNHD